MNQTVVPNNQQFYGVDSTKVQLIYFKYNLTLCYYPHHYNLNPLKNQHFLVINGPNLHLNVNLTQFKLTSEC